MTKADRKIESQPLSIAEAPCAEGRLGCKDLTAWLREAGSFQKLEKEVREGMCSLEQNCLLEGGPQEKE